MTHRGAAAQHEVQVDGEKCIVWVGQSRGSTWRAYGDFRGQHIDKTGRSSEDALNNWKRAAEYAANE
jgi:hypothetical protein